MQHDNYKQEDDTGNLLIRQEVAPLLPFSLLETLTQANRSQSVARELKCTNYYPDHGQALQQDYKNTKPSLDYQDKELGEIMQCIRTQFICVTE